MLWYSLEVPRRGAFNEYLKHIFKCVPTTYVFGEKQEKYPYFFVEKSALPGAV